MKLTKLQRYVFYILMMEELDKTGFYGLCKAAGSVGLVNDIGYVIIETHLTELSKRLQSLSEEWRYSNIFSKSIDGYKKRIELLEQCIEETHP